MGAHGVRPAFAVREQWATIAAMHSTPSPSVADTPLIHWLEADQPCSARWRSERGAPPPKKVVLADDTMSADTAYRLACEGTALLWRGDFPNARQMLQAIARRSDDSGKTDKRGRKPKVNPLSSSATQLIAGSASATAAAAGLAINSVPAIDPAEAAKGFHMHRQAQAQRARVLGMVLITFDADYAIALRRAPDARVACTEAWGAAEGAENAGPSVASLRELLGVISAHEWRKNGIEIPALGVDPDNRMHSQRIHPHYGVYSPLRGEYVGLMVKMPLPKVDLPQGAAFTAFDIGTGTGVLTAVLARRGVDRMVATDLDPRALTCAAENLKRLRVNAELVQANLFPPVEMGLAHLIVCNPPWLPARPSSPLEHAVYDEGSGMLLGYLSGLAAHLAPDGEGWLILSDLAEHLGLRTRAELLAAIKAAGLQVAGRMDAKPTHGKVADTTDPLHLARSKEVTSLWRLKAKVAKAAETA